VTRPPAKPDKHVEVTTERCPDCGTELGDPFRVESRIIEEIPEPQPVIVTEYKIAHYTCPCCRKEVVATAAGCPKEGIFGNNTIAQAALQKYEDRLPAPPEDPERTEAAVRIRYKSCHDTRSHSSCYRCGSIGIRSDSG